jgi:hypothetical protein
LLPHCSHIVTSVLIPSGTLSDLIFNTVTGDSATMWAMLRHHLCAAAELPFGVQRGWTRLNKTKPWILGTVIIVTTTSDFIKVLYYVNGSSNLNFRKLLICRRCFSCRSGLLTPPRAHTASCNSVRIAKYKLRRWLSSVMLHRVVSWILGQQASLKFRTISVRLYTAQHPRRQSIIFVLVAVRTLHLTKYRLILSSSRPVTCCHLWAAQIWTSSNINNKKNKNSANVEHEMFRHTGNHWSHRNCN